jgi:nitroreductase
MTDAISLTRPFIPHPTTSTPFTVPNLLHCLETRRSVKPAGLSEPGPNPDELRRLLTVASRVPDHGALVPWRFILFQGDARQAACAQLAAAYSAQHPDLSEQTVGTLAKLSGVLYRREPGACQRCATAGIYPGRCIAFLSIPDMGSAVPKCL